MFVDFLIRRFAADGRRPAVVAPAARCTFGELARSVEGWGEELDGGGIDPGTVVGLEADFTPSSIGLLLALSDKGVEPPPPPRKRRLDRILRRGAP